MKGQSKRFVNHKGEIYDSNTEILQQDDATNNNKNENIGFLDLWRYASLPERSLTVLSAVLAWFCSGALIAAVVSYGEFTALFVNRHKAETAAGRAVVLAWFGGGRVVPSGNRSLHMDALVEDATAFGLASLAIIAVQVTAAAAAVTIANGAAGSMVTRIRWRLLRAVIRQEVAFFDTNTTMNFANTLTDDMEKLRQGVGEHVAMTSYLGGSVVLGAVMSLLYGWELTLVGLSVVPLAIGVAHTVAKYQTKCSAREVTLYGAAGRIVEEVLAGIRTVRAYGGEDSEVNRYTDALKPASVEAHRRGTLAGTGAGLGWTLTYALNAIVFGYGAVLIVRDMTLPVEEQAYHPGVMVTILFCTFMSVQNIAMTHPHLEIFSTARGAARSIFKLLERRSLIDSLDESGEKPERFKGDIVFDNVYFNYPSRSDVKVLRGLSLTIRAGETVALVGGSGSGKSTCLQLLQRLYEAQSGSITVDGKPLERLNLHHYRSSIGVVGQEPVLFSGTIRENIALGMDDVSDDDVIAASKTAHAHQFISKLAQGYNTVLGERSSLSGGQKQRIAIARACLRHPAVLLLDEPTSALDPAAERQVQAALDAAAKGRTTVVVSHRLSTIVNASRIVYIEQGAVLEQGTHQELMEKKGMYWKLVQEDLTSRSINNALAASSAADNDDDVIPVKEQVHFRRSNFRQSSRMSVARASMVRASRRVVSHVPHLTAPELPAQDPDSDSEDEDLPSVSPLELIKLNAPEWKLLALGGSSSFLIGATMPVFALLFSKVYGMFASSEQAEILHSAALYSGLFALTAAVCGAVTFLQTWAFNRAGAALTDRLRVMSFQNYLKQEQGWFDEPKNSVGALCARLATDCAAVQGATGTRLGTVLQGVSTMVIGVGLSLPYSWKMTLVSLLSLPIVIGGIYLEGWVTKRAEENERKSLEDASKVATEAVTNLRTVQSLGVEQVLLSRYSTALRRAGGGRTRLIARGAAYGACMCAPTLGYCVSLVYGGWLIAREGLPYEYTILVSEALIYGAWMLAEALSFAPSFAAASRSGARIIHALNKKPNIVTEDTAKDMPGWHSKGDINFSSIHFSYPTRSEVPVLKGLELSVEAGKTVALVGPSGCGKSTLMHLLMRSYDAKEGNVTLDTHNIRSALPLHTLRRQLGLVQQEPALFSRSLYDNIAYGDNSRSVPLEEVIEAAKQANVHQFIASLPLGYDTVLGEGSAALSGGQKQRVCIARALVRNPRVLLLDEATSALDAATEKGVQASLEAASKGRSTLVIAHRLATVQHADVIAVIDKGVVVEKGSHEELIKRRGVYWELLQQQAPTALA